MTNAVFSLAIGLFRFLFMIQFGQFSWNLSISKNLSISSRVFNLLSILHSTITFISIQIYPKVPYFISDFS